MTAVGTARRPLAGLALLAVAATVTVAAIAAATAGLHALVVTSSSMAPTLDAGDVVIVDPAVPPAPGAIVVVDRSGRLVTHRVVTVNSSDVVLRGDATSVTDPPDPAYAVVGTVIRVVPAVGLPAIAARDHPWTPAVVAAVIAGAILTAGYRRHDASNPSERRP